MYGNMEMELTMNLLVADWSIVCKPKGEEDLGVLDLRTQNQALVLKKPP